MLDVVMSWIRDVFLKHNIYICIRQFDRRLGERDDKYKH